MVANDGVSRPLMSQFLLRERLKLYENFGVNSGQVKTPNLPGHANIEAIPVAAPTLVHHKLVKGAVASMKVAGFRADRLGSVTYREVSDRVSPNGPRSICLDDIHVGRSSQPHLSSQPITGDDLESEIQRVIAEQAASLKKRFGEQAHLQVTELLQAATKDAASLQSTGLDRIIESYSKKFQSIISSIEETESVKSQIKRLEQNVASMRASNQRMAADHEDNIRQLQEQYEILQLQVRPDLSHQQKVEMLRERIRTKQNEVHALETELENQPEQDDDHGDDDEKISDQIDPITTSEDPVEKSLLEEIAAVKRNLAESKEAAATIQKKLARQRKRNEMLKNQVAAAEAKCRQAEALIDQERENEQVREQNLKQSFLEQKQGVVAVFRQIRDTVYQCKKVASGLESGLTCSACLNEFRDPYLFSPCGHTCCHQCIPDTRSCPICSHDTDSPPTTAIATNQLLRRIVEQYRWFTDPMTKAGDAIIELCSQILKRSEESSDLPD